MDFPELSQESLMTDDRRISARWFQEEEKHWQRAQFLIVKVVEKTVWKQLGVSINGGIPKSSINRWIFPYKPSIWGYHHLWKPPLDLTWSRFQIETALIGATLWIKLFPLVVQMYGESFSFKLKCKSEYGERVCGRTYVIWIGQVLIMVLTYQNLFPGQWRKFLDQKDTDFDHCCTDATLWYRYYSDLQWYSWNCLWRHQVFFFPKQSNTNLETFLEVVGPWV